MNIIVAIFILGLFSSNSKEVVDTSAATQSDIGSTIVSTDTVTILGEKYWGIGTSEYKLIVLNSKGDTVLNQPDLYFDFEFVDFDGDSLKDIVVHRLSNVPAIQNLLLFDKETDGLQR